MQWGLGRENRRLNLGVLRPKPRSAEQGSPHPDQASPVSEHGVRPLLHRVRELNGFKHVRLRDPRNSHAFKSLCAWKPTRCPDPSQTNAGPCSMKVSLVRERPRSCLRESLLSGILCYTEEKSLPKFDLEEDVRIVLGSARRREDSVQSSRTQKLPVGV